MHVETTSMRVSEQASGSKSVIMDFEWETAEGVGEVEGRQIKLCRNFNGFDPFLHFVSSCPCWSVWHGTAALQIILSACSQVEPPIKTRWIRVLQRRCTKPSLNKKSQTCDQCNDRTKAKYLNLPKANRQLRQDRCLNQSGVLPKG